MSPSKFYKILLVILVFVLQTAVADAPAQSFLSRKKISAKAPEEEREAGITDKIKSYWDFFSSVDSEEETDDSGDVYPQYNMKALSEISLMIKDKDCDLALSSLKKLRSASEEDISEESKMELDEFESYLFVEANFCLGNYDEVVKEADNYFSRRNNGERHYRVYYFLTGALFRLEKPLELTSRVTKEHFSALTEDEAASLRNFLVRDALSKNQIFKAFSFLEEDQDKLIDDNQDLLKTIIQRIRKIEHVDEALDRYKNDDIKFPLFLRKLQLIARDGQHRLVEDYLALLKKEGKVSIEECTLLRDYVNTDFHVVSFKIGVILPFSHKKFGRLARKTLDGLELALKDDSGLELTLKDDSGLETPLRLILKDSADIGYKSASLSASERLVKRKKLVKKQVEELVKKDGVIAILGPLTKDISIAAGEAAEKYNTPVISFSKTENIGKNRDSLFRFHNNKLEEAKLLACYAMDYLGAERFVLFYKPGEKSFKVMKAFEKEVRKKKGKIVGIAKVRPKQADLNNIFLSVTDGLRKVSKDQREEMKKLRVDLDPVIDFDALFVPFNLKTLKVAANFAEFFNAEKVWLLAGDEINVRENRLLDDPKKLIFTGAFPVGQSTGRLRRFFESHWKLYNHRSPYYPPGDYAIYAYEALEIIVNLLNKPGQYHSREFLKSSLRDLKDFSALSGQVSAFKNGELLKEQKILKIKNFQTVKVF